jgi:hypothetical protein
MSNKSISLTSILQDIQDSIYKVNQQESLGVVVKNAAISLKCFVSNPSRKEVLLSLPDPAQSFDKEFKEAVLSEISLSFASVLTDGLNNHPNDAASGSVEREKENFIENTSKNNNAPTENEPPKASITKEFLTSLLNKDNKSYTIEN